MFKKRHVTSSLASSVGTDIQIILWDLIDNWNSTGVQVDCLHFFELSVEYAIGEVYQKVIHRQKQPSKEETFYYMTVQHPIDIAIWVVANKYGATMMHVEESVLECEY